MTYSRAFMPNSLTCLDDSCLAKKNQNISIKNKLTGLLLQLIDCSKLVVLKEREYRHHLDMHYKRVR